MLYFRKVMYAIALGSFALKCGGAIAQTLSPNQALTSNQSLTAVGTGANCAFKAIMQGDGNFVVYRGSAAYWFTKTAGNSGAKIIMQSDGNLVIYRANGTAAWSSGTAGKGGALLSLLGNGQLRITNASGAVVWQAPGTSAAGCTVSAASIASDRIRGLIRSTENLTYDLKWVVTTLLGRPYDQALSTLLKPTYNEMVSAVASSAEYFTRCGGTNDLFINQLTLHLAGRAPTSAEVAAAKAKIAGNNRSAAVDYINSLQASRYRRINSLYRRFLRREATATELAAMFGANNEVESLVAMLQSAEYKSLAAARDDI